MIIKANGYNANTNIKRPLDVKAGIRVLKMSNNFRDYLKDQKRDKYVLTKHLDCVIIRVQ